MEAMTMRPADSRNRSGMGMIGAIVALVIAAIIGFGLWSVVDYNTTALTGSSATPSPSNPPAAPGPAGQGE
jgi:hypothetical protein